MEASYHAVLLHLPFLRSCLSEQLHLNLEKHKN